MLQILLCSDLAGKLPVIFADDIAQSDLIFIAGDITLGAKAVNRAQIFLEKLAELFPPSKTVYFIPGNHDLPFLSVDQPWYPPHFIQMHNRTLEIRSSQVNKPIFLVGFGGAKLGLYNNFAFSEEEIYSHLKKLFESIATKRQTAPYLTILLGHDPPQNTALDLNFQKNHVGSESMRAIIEKYQPDLAVSGHIHESAAVESIGKTICVNAGESRQDKYAIIQIENEKIHITLHG